MRLFQRLQHSGARRVRDMHGAAADDRTATCAGA
jgi:hypothetical protein